MKKLVSAGIALVLAAMLTTRRCEREGSPKHPMDVSRKATTACLMVVCGKGGSIPQAAMPPYRESEDLPP